MNFRARGAGHRSPALSFCVLLFTLGSRVSALAWSADLDHPSLSFAPGAANEKAVMGVVADKQFAFQRGHFVNAHSTLEYGGNAAALNAFLARLTECKGVSVTVTFGKAAGKMSWTLDHDAWGGNARQFLIEVNTARIAEAAVKVPK